MVIMVGDGGTLQDASAAKTFVPRDLGQLVNAINKVKKNDRLYLRLLRPAPGVVIGTSEMPNLPPSALATLNNDRTAGGYKPFVQTVVVDREVPPSDFVITGQQTLSIQVIK